MASPFSGLAPGAAASNAIEELMVQRTQLAHQGLQDRLQLMKLQEDRRQADQILNERRQEHQDDLNEKDRQSTLKAVSQLQMGDIPDADLVAKAKKYLIPLPMEAEHTTPVAAPSSVPEPPASLAAPGPTTPPPQMEGMPARPPDGTLRFAGTHGNRASRALAESFPRGSQERLAIDYENATGRNIPANLVKPPTTVKSEEVFRQNPRDGSIDHFTNGVWQPWTQGAVPTGSHWETVQPPKDTSAKDDREAFHLDQVRHEGTQAIAANPIVKSTEDQINTLNKLDLSMRQNNNLGDSVIAEQVLKLTAGGTGSGLRLNNVLIDRILKGTRTKWDNLNLVLNSWGGDPNKPLVLDADQRDAIRKLAAEGRKIANQAHSRIIQARRTIDNAKTTNEVYDAQTNLLDDLGKSQESDETPANKPSAEERLQQILHPVKK